MTGARRAVVCDFGGVLTTPLGNAFSAWQDELGVPLEDIGQAMAASLERHGEHPLFVLEEGRITQDEMLRRLSEELGSELQVDSLFDVFLANLHRNPAMIELMADLRRRGVRMALLTNNVREWEARWRAIIPELDEIFEVVVDSAFVGMRKPDPAIYELTVERLGGGLTPADCVFVDDMEVNGAAAVALGMAGVRFEDEAQATREIEAALAA